MDAYKGEEPCCEATTDTGKKVVASSSVEQNDNYWSLRRASKKRYVNGRPARVELDPDIDLTLISNDVFQLIQSEASLRQVEEIIETTTGVSSVVVGKASIGLQLGQFRRWTDVLVVDGLDVFWYKLNASLVLVMNLVRSATVH